MQQDEEQQVDDFMIGYTSGAETAQQGGVVTPVALFHLAFKHYKWAIQSVCLQREAFMLGFKWGYRDMISGII
jgi:hypothetical protein